MGFKLGIDARPHRILGACNRPFAPRALQNILRFVCHGQPESVKEMHMFYDGNDYMGGMHGVWWIFWMLLIGALVFYGWGQPDSPRQGARERPQDVLQRRLASGEIARDRYEKRKALLDRDTGGMP